MRSSYSSSSELSSSEISSSSSSDASSVHHRSTPKIAAVIIAAIIVITGLIGVTVYLVDGEHFGGGGGGKIVVDEVEIVEETREGAPDTSLDFRTYRDDSASVMQRHQMQEGADGKEEGDPNLANHQPRLPNRFRPGQKQNLSFRDRKDPEGPADLSIYEDDYYQDGDEDDDEEGDPERRVQQEHPVPHHGRRNQFPPLLPPPPPPRVSLTDGPPQSGGASVGAGEVAEGGPPYGTRLKGKGEQQGEEGEAHHQMYGMDRYGAVKSSVQGGAAAAAALLRRRQQLLQKLRARKQHRQRLHSGQDEVMQLDESTFAGEDLLEAPPRPPGGSRGGVRRHHHVSQEDGGEEGEEGVMGGGGGITTLDRRPGRPAFHHLGPVSPALRDEEEGVSAQEAAFRRRQKLMELRRRQGALQRRLGMLAQGGNQQKQQAVPVNPVVRAKLMLRKFGNFVDLAKSEVAMIRDIAR